MKLKLRTADEVLGACRRKTQYGTEQMARQVARQAIRLNPGCPPRLWVYPCAACRQWHLSKERNASLPVTAWELREGVAA